MGAEDLFSGCPDTKIGFKLIFKDLNIVNNLGVLSMTTVACIRIAGGVSEGNQQGRSWQ
jgi:hypothetical protein